MMKKAVTWVADGADRNPPPSGGGGCQVVTQYDLPAPMPPVRAVDAELPQRVARGLGGVWEARQIEELMALMQRYERALAWVAVHGDRDSAMLARRVLAGDWGDAWAAAQLAPGEGIVDGVARAVAPLQAELERLQAEVESLHRILGRIVEGDGELILTIHAGEDAFAAAREYLLRHRAVLPSRSSPGSPASSSNRAT